jgi:hypothetical protein
MKKIKIEFYSHRPRLRVELVWTTDSIPNVGDEIRIKNRFISQLDKKYFPKWRRDLSMTFRIKKRFWNLDRRENTYLDYDVILELYWTENELVEIEKYIKNSKQLNKNKMATLNIKGTVTKVLTPKPYSEGKLKQPFVITTDDKYNPDIVVDVFNDKFPLTQGEQVDIDCNVSSRVSEANYFTNISVWRKNQVQQLAPATPITAKHIETIVQQDTDLPF